MTWYLYAVLSALTAGVYTFLQKVAVERGYSSTLVNTWSTFIASVVAFSVVILFSQYETQWVWAIGLGIASGVLHLIGSVARMDALRYIDTAIYFPLNKTVGPLIVLGISIIFFNETFTGNEWIGIAFGITVPLMLLHKSESARQNNLRKGVLIMIVGATFAAIASAISKYGAGSLESVFLFLAVSLGSGAFSGLLLHRFRNKQEHNVVQKSDLWGSFVYGGLCGITQFLSFVTLMLAFMEGSLAIVYTINSFYILIPIVLSILIYGEHWNARKLLAIGFSLLAVGFLR
ncbi:MAG: putative membrane protein [Candidatus Azotimanducaceae bacterium]|jgi:uncharacterized membrane protein